MAAAVTKDYAEIGIDEMQALNYHRINQVIIVTCAGKNIVAMMSRYAGVFPRKR